MMHWDIAVSDFGQPLGQGGGPARELKGAVPWLTPGPIVGRSILRLI